MTNRNGYFQRTETARNFIGTAYVEPVDGETMQYDLFIELTKEELSTEPGEYGWDTEVVYSDGDVAPLVRGTLTLWQSMGDLEER